MAVKHTKKGTGVAAKAKQLAEEVKAKLTGEKSPTHAPECGEVGETGEHGDLGSNAAKK